MNFEIFLNLLWNFQTEATLKKHEVFCKIMITVRQRLSSSIGGLINEIFQSIKDEYDHLEEQLEGHRFRFKFVSRLNTRCHKVNASRGSSFTKSLDWFKSNKSTK